MLWGTKVGLRGLANKMPDPACQSAHSLPRQHDQSSRGYARRETKSVGWAGSRFRSSIGGMKEGPDQIARALFNTFVKNDCANVKLLCFYQIF